MSNTLSAQISPSQSWNTSLEFFPGVVWELHSALCGKLCLALQPAKISLATPGASCLLPDGQGFFSFGFRLTQQRWHTPIYVTAQNCALTQPALNGCSPINVILPLLSRDLGGKDPSLLICGTGTLQLLSDLFRGAWEHTATPSPRKAQFQAPGVKLRATDSHLTTDLLETKARYAEDARARLAGAAEADACPHLPALPSSDYQQRGRGTRETLKVRARRAREIGVLPNYFT